MSTFDPDKFAHFALEHLTDDQRERWVSRDSLQHNLLHVAILRFEDATEENRTKEYDTAMLLTKTNVSKKATNKYGETPFDLLTNLNDYQKLANALVDERIVCPLFRKLYY